MLISDALQELVGTAPAGYEPLLWLMSCVVLFFLLTSAFSIIGAVLNWIGGK